MAYQVVLVSSLFFLSGFFLYFSFSLNAFTPYYLHVGERIFGAVEVRRLLGFDHLIQKEVTGLLQVSCSVCFPSVVQLLLFKVVTQVKLHQVCEIRLVWVCWEQTCLVGHLELTVSHHYNYYYLGTTTTTQLGRTTTHN